MAFPYTFPDIIIAMVSLIILWILISIPLWLAGKAITRGKATFTDALLATLAGPIIYFLVTFFSDLFLTALIGPTAFLFGYILSMIAWIWIYKASFRTGWIKAILIAVFAWVLFIILSFIVGVLFDFTYPSPFFPPINFNFF